jgi:proteic killer suppression protein
MIKSFRSKRLREVFEESKSAKIDTRLHSRIRARLDALDQAVEPRDLNVPGWNFHALLGFDPVRYTIHVNGPWCITFEFAEGDAYRVDFEQYH